MIDLSGKRRAGPEWRISAADRGAAAGFAYAKLPPRPIHPTPLAPNPRVAVASPLARFLR